MFQKLFEKLGELIFRRNKLFILVTVAVVVALGACITMLRFDSDATQWVDKNSKVGKMPHYIGQTFGSYNPILVAVETENVFTKDNLERLRELGDQIGAMTVTNGKKEVSRVVEEVNSIANIDDVTATPEGIKVEKLIHYPVDGDPAKLAALRNYTLSKKNYAGRLVSKDGRSALMVVKPMLDVKTDRLAKDIKAMADQVFRNSGAKLYFTGNAFLINSISDMVMNDFAFLIPAVSVLVILILFISFRSLRGVVLPLLTVLFSAAMTMGFMGLVGSPLNVLSSAIPVLLVAVGSAYGIHVINNYYEMTEHMVDKKKIIITNLKNIGLPVLMAGLTTIAGFISNVTADISIIKTFGVFMAFGIMVAMAIALVFIPAYMAGSKIKRNRYLERKEEINQIVKMGTWTKVLADFVIKRKYLVIILFSVVGIGLFAFASRITSKADFLDYFQYDSEPKVAGRFMNREFGGFNSFNIYVKADIQDPDVLKFMTMLQEEIKSYSNLPAPSGIGDIVSELNYSMTGINGIPETKAEVENLWFFVQGNSMVDGMVTHARTEAISTVMLPNQENDFIDGLIGKMNGMIENYTKHVKIAENIPGNPYQLALETLMMKNLFRFYGLAFQDADLEARVANLVRLSAEFRSALPGQKLVSYLIGDESEIPFTENQARQIVSSLGRLKDLSKAAIVEDLKKTVTLADGYTNEDRENLARSLAIMIREANVKGKMNALIRKARMVFPETKTAANDDFLNFALSPMVWETIPVPAKETQNIVREASIEKVELTGVAYLFELMRRSILNNQMVSILIALAVVLILNCITFRSFTEGLISLTSIVFTIMVNFGIMGLLNIPLDFVTAIIGSVIIGTGIDYTIHFISRFNREMEQHGQDYRQAYENTLASSGRAIVFNALSVGLGFAVLLGSNVIPLRTAGTLLAATMFVSSFSALTFLPAVIVALRVNFGKKRKPKKHK